MCALGLIGVMATSAQAQSDAVQRTPHGDPDISGMFTFRTITPLERPSQFADQETLDAETAAAFEASERTRQNRDLFDPESGAPSAGYQSRAEGGVLSYNEFWYERGVDLTDDKRTSLVIDPPNGRQPPRTAEAQAALAGLAASFRPNTGTAWWLEDGLNAPGPYDDMEIRPAAERCLLGFGSTAGPPMLPVLYNNLKRIVQTEDTILIQVEMVHEARVIRMNDEHAPPEISSWLGDSVGRWEGDTLVVDTTNFSDSPALSGASRNLHVVERFTRLDNDTLLYNFTVNDPTVWTAPWTGEYIWPASDTRVYEYACHEANYALEGIMKGARLLEAEARGEETGGVVNPTR